MSTSAFCLLIRRLDGESEDDGYLASVVFDSSDSTPSTPHLLNALATSLNEGLLFRCHAHTMLPTHGGCLISKGRVLPWQQQRPSAASWLS